MPYYDLRCVKCGKEFNSKASIADRTEGRIPCPACGAYDMETVFKAAPAYIKSREASECPNSHICGAGCRHAN